MARIFISYRRADSAEQVARIFDQLIAAFPTIGASSRGIASAGRFLDRLVAAFSRNSVFMDVDSIPGGADFPRVLEAAIQKAEIILVVLGPTWLNIADEIGQRRLEKPDDYVRLELEAALRLGRFIIPVLVKGASMPGEDQLPETLREITFRNALRVRSDRDFHRDMEDLVLAIKSGVEESRRKGPVRPPPPRSVPRPAGPVVAREVATIERSGEVPVVNEGSFRELLDRLDRVRGLPTHVRDGFRRAITIADQDPEMSLTRSRSILENIVHDIHRRRVNEPGTRPLEQLLQNILKEGAFPRKLGAYAQTVKELGNIGAHGVGERIDQADVIQSLNALLPIVEWYVTQDPPGAFEPSSEIPVQRPAPQAGAYRAAWPIPAAAQSSAGPSARGPVRAPVMPPPYIPPLPSSGKHPAIGRPPPGPGARTPDSLLRNASFWMIGAMAGAAVGGSFGGLAGRFMVALQNPAPMDSQARDTIVIALLFGGLLGAMLGTMLAAMGEAWGSRRAAASRGILVGAMLGWLILQICAWTRVPFIGPTPQLFWLWTLAGGPVGAAGGLVAVLSWKAGARGLAGAIAGAVVLVVLRLLLSQPWHLAVCVFLGGLTGAAAEFTALGVGRGRRDPSPWLLGCFAAWAVLEARTSDYRLLVALAILGMIGALVGMIVHFIGSRIAANSGR